MAREVTPDQFAAELRLSAARLPAQGARVVKKAAQNIKDESRANVQRSAPTHNAHAHYAISYDDPTIAGAVVRSQVGYDKGLPGGSLGNLLEYGGAGDKSPAHRDVGRAADSEEPRFEDAIVDMVRRLW